MKIIDEKGRLFGKINVIDFLVILFLLSMAPMFYFGYKITREKPKIIEEASRPEGLEQPTASKEVTEIEVRCLFIKLKPEVVKALSVGDKELDKNGDAIGEIVSLGEITPYFYHFDVGAGRKFSREDPVLKQVPATLKIKAEIKGNSIYYKDRQITFNGALEFKTDKYQTEAIAALRDDPQYVGMEERIVVLEEKLTGLNTRISNAEHEIEVMLAKKQEVKNK